MKNLVYEASLRLVVYEASLRLNKTYSEKIHPRATTLSRVKGFGVFFSKH